MFSLVWAGRGACVCVCVCMRACVHACVGVHVCACDISVSMCPRLYTCIPISVQQICVCSVYSVTTYSMGMNKCSTKSHGPIADKPHIYLSQHKC